MRNATFILLALLALPLFAQENPVNQESTSATATESSAKTWFDPAMKLTWHYEVLDDNSAKIVGVGEFKEKFEKLTVPSVIDGHPVTTLGFAAFKGAHASMDHSKNSTLDARLIVCIPTSVTTIEEGTFHDTAPRPSNTLTSRTLVELAPGNEHFTIEDRFFLISKEGHLLHAYRPLNRPFAEIPDGVVRIGAHVLEECDLYQVSFPDSLVEIGDHAFKGTQLQEIELPFDVKVIGKYAFSRCYELKKISFPENLTIIDDSAFSNCDSLVLVELPKKMEKIGKKTFAYNRSLKYLVFPETVTEFGKDAFKRCPMKEILFQGGPVDIERPREWRSCEWRVFEENLDAWNRAIATGKFRGINIVEVAQLTALSMIRLSADIELEKKRRPW